MRRSTAFFLLALVTFFVASAPMDSCADEGEECPRACHLACADGCGVVTVAATSPALPVLAPLAENVHLAALRLLDCPHEPELGPPRVS